MTPIEREEYDQALADLRTHMDEQVFATDWTKGRSMRKEDAIACALELVD